MTSKNIGVSNPKTCIKTSRVPRTQTQCALEMVERRLVLTDHNSYPTAVGPCRRQVGVERKRPINKGETCIDVTRNIRKGVPAQTQCNRVFPTQVRSSTG